MIGSTLVSQGQELMCISGIRLEPEDLAALYERSVIHAEHGIVKKVSS